jgi:GPH family glycoside/pentoside/hexuronide:cation symporter
MSDLGRKQKFAFSLSYLPTWLISGVFQVWVFSFYFSAVILPIYYIMIAYVIYSVWNAINDPLIGFLSDHTKTRWGRRKPYILIGTIPVISLAIIIWTPPTQDNLTSFIYLLIMLFMFDTFYTMLEVPYDCIFPEIYISVEERAEVNTYKQIFSVIGLILAFLIPGIIIEDIAIIDGYLISGIIITIIMSVTLAISIKWGVVEREEFKYDSEYAFGFFQGLKYVFKNRGFLLYTIMFLGFEYNQLLQATLIPLFAKHVIGENDPFIATIFLGILFFIAIATVYVWKKLDLRFGSRITYFLTIVVYFIASIPILFVTDAISLIIPLIFMGFGYGGMMYFNYLIIADIIDEDELKTGVRREGTFFGITSFFMRFAGVLSILTISLVFLQTGWEEYTPNPSVNEVLGLRILMFVFPAIDLGIISVCLYFYPFTKARVMEIKDKVVQLHEKKRERVIKEGGN